MQGCVLQTSTDLSFPTLPTPSPTLVISKVAVETDKVIALSQDLMKHKTPKVHGGLIRAAFQSLLLSVQGEKEVRWGRVSDCKRTA